MCCDKAVRNDGLADWPLGFLFTRRNTRKKESGEKGKREFAMSTEHLETSRDHKGLGWYRIWGSTQLVIKTTEVRNQGARQRETLSGSDSHETRARTYEMS